jgi:hypothetical protein
MDYIPLGQNSSNFLRNIRQVNRKPVSASKDSAEASDEDSFIIKCTRMPVINKFHMRRDAVEARMEGAAELDSGSEQKLREMPEIF